MCISVVSVFSGIAEDSDRVSMAESVGMVIYTHSPPIVFHKQPKSEFHQ